MAGGRAILVPTHPEAGSGLRRVVRVKSAVPPCLLCAFYINRGFNRVGID